MKAVIPTIQMNGEHDHWFEFDGNRYHFPSHAQAAAALAKMLKVLK